MKIRVGFGYDVHQLKDGLPLTIGGVRIAHTKGWVAHSDGDVLIHAICDALLGAAALQDIGYHFPDTDPTYRGIDSRELLRHVTSLLLSHGYAISNVDATIAMQRPKLRPHIDNMRALLAQDMNISADDVSVKATTTERLGFEGQETGASAYAVVLIQKQ